jgi:hypothetical protein
MFRGAEIPRVVGTAGIASLPVMRQSEASHADSTGFWVSSMKGHHTRRPGLRLGTCAHCGDLFDLHKEPTEARGRYCSMTCLTAARRDHGIQIESVLTLAPLEAALAPPPAIQDVH